MCILQHLGCLTRGMIISIQAGKDAHVTCPEHSQTSGSTKALLGLFAHEVPCHERLDCPFSKPSRGTAKHAKQTARTTKVAWAENSRVWVRRMRLRLRTPTSSATLASRPSASHTLLAKARAGVPSSSCDAHQLTVTQPAQETQNAHARFARQAPLEC